MIGKLPTQLEVNGKMCDIRTDYRDILVIFQAFNDPDLSDQEKQRIMIEILYKDIPDNLQEAVEQANWFLNCGQVYEESTDQPTYDWEQDEQMIFSAINKVAGHEIRSDEYMHFWTFIGLFQGIGESLFSTVVNIRDKKNNGKKLDKVDQEFYDKNKSLIILKKKRSVADQAFIDRVNAKFT